MTGTRPECRRAATSGAARIDCAPASLAVAEGGLYPSRGAMPPPLSPPPNGRRTSLRGGMNAWAPGGLQLTLQPRTRPAGASTPGATGVPPLRREWLVSGRGPVEVDAHPPLRFGAVQDLQTGGHERPRALRIPRTPSLVTSRSPRHPTHLSLPLSVKFRPGTLKLHRSSWDCGFASSSPAQHSAVPDTGWVFRTL